MHDAKPKGHGWQARCPAHDDQRPSLTISEGENGRVLLHCHAGCTIDSVLRAAQLTPADLFAPTGNGNGRKPAHGNGHAGKSAKCYSSEAEVLAVLARVTEGRHVATWTYYKAGGAEAFRVARFNKSDGAKEHRPYRREGDGWAIGDPRGKLPLYRLSTMGDAARVWVFEGEKCADLAADLGLVATTSAHGAKSAKKTDWRPLAGMNVMLVPDHDTAGNEYVEEVRRLLHELAPQPRVRVVELPGLANPGDDLEQFIEARDCRTPEEIRAELDTLADAAPLVDVVGVPAPAAPGEIDVAAVAANFKAGVEALHEAGKLPAAFHKTDYGNAERFARQHGDRVRYSGAMGWLAWDGRRWAMDTTGAVYRLAKQTVRSIYREAGELADDNARAAVAKHAADSERAGRIAAMLTLAQSELPIAFDPGTLDADGWILNVANGTLDLRTGELRPHRPADMLTKLAPVAYSPDASAPRFDRFLRETFAADPELILFVQRSIGYALTGVVREAVVHFLYGLGANGKSTLVETIFAVLGDYGLALPEHFFAERRNPDNAASPDLADLRGVRFAAGVETEEHMVLSESRIKWLTGRDRIRARQLYRDFIEFPPTHKLFLATNHRPIIKGTDHATWRRVRLWPFDVAIAEEDQDPELADKLRDEAPGILAWAVRGCRAWRESGAKLGCPDAVSAATNAYRTDSDVFGTWLSECCVLMPAAETDDSTLYPNYTSWADRSGVYRLSKPEWAKRMIGHGLTKRKSHGARLYRGVRLAVPSMPVEAGDL